MKRKFLAVLLTSALVVSALTGCDDEGTTDSSTSSQSSQSSSVDSSSDSGSADDAGEAEEASGSEDTTEAGDSGSSTDTSWADNLTEFYAGKTDDDDTYMYLAFNGEGTFGVVMFYEVENAQSGSWVGDCTNNGDGTMTVSDQNNGTSLTFAVEAIEGGYNLDMGDVGSAQVGAIEKDQFVQCAENISNGTEPQF